MGRNSSRRSCSLILYTPSPSLTRALLINHAKSQSGADSSMSERPKAVVFWSTGKDSAHALYEIMQGDQFEVAGLVTTVTSSARRVFMHGVREELLDRQIEAVGLRC